VGGKKLFYAAALNCFNSALVGKGDGRMGGGGGKGSW